MDQSASATFHVKLNYCGWEQAIALMSEHYAVGSVEIKVVLHKPFN
ncbi:MAG: hypothetical protein ACRCZS_18945 [Chroococcidiopsis sp.]